MTSRGDDMDTLLSLELRGDVLDFKAVGSRVTCNPPPTDTDQDWLALVPGRQWTAFSDALTGEGWEIGGSMVPNGENYLPADQRFLSFTKGIDNIIATCSLEFYKRFLAATSVSKRFNLLDKGDRIALFQAVLYAKESEWLA